jgi:type VI secretion system protein ImpM
MTPIKISYFGKIPSRGDFIKAADQISLVQVFDEWLTEAMTLIAEDPRWKMNYDAAKPLDFTFLGMHRNHAIAGHISPSSDSASRRFPFLTLSTIETPTDIGFINNSPLIFSRLWHKLGLQSQQIVQTQDAMHLLQELNQTPIEIELDYKSYQASFNNYLEIQTMGGLSQLLAQSGFSGDLRQLMIAIGILLQPVMSSQNTELAKYLMLPTTQDTMHQQLIAAFWLTLITPFLSNLDIELAIFLSQFNHKPVMLIGFSGASAHMLQAILTPQPDNPDLISLEDAEWVENHIHEDFGIKKLSSHLVQSELSLSTAIALYNTTFIGT